MKFLIVAIVVIILVLLLVTGRYIELWGYEQPHALIGGENVAGTVYASEPENNPGLGWIL